MYSTPYIAGDVYLCFMGIKPVVQDVESEVKVSKLAAFKLVLMIYQCKISGITSTC